MIMPNARAAAAGNPKTHKHFFFFSLVLAACMAASLQAAPLSDPETAALMDRVAKAATESGFRAHFRETKKLSLLKEPQISEGEISLLAPDSFRKRTDSPIPSEIISDGKNLWIAMPDSRRAEYYDISKHREIAAPIHAFTAAMSGKADQFRVLAETENDGWLIELRPRSPALRRSVECVRIRLGGDLLAREIVVEAPGGNLSSTVLDHREKTPLRAEDFRYEPPQGFEVVAPFGG